MDLAPPSCNICNVYMEHRTVTDRDMQMKFCKLAQDTDTNPVTRAFPNTIENFCGSCNRGPRMRDPRRRY